MLGILSLVQSMSSTSGRQLHNKGPQSCPLPAPPSNHQKPSNVDVKPVLLFCPSRYVIYALYRFYLHSPLNLEHQPRFASVPFRHDWPKIESVTVITIPGHGAPTHRDERSPSSKRMAPPALTRLGVVLLPDVPRAFVFLAVHRNLVSIFTASRSNRTLYTFSTILCLSLA
jgi:hypothetical protein